MSIPVTQFSLEGKELETFANAKEASKKCHIPAQNIGQVCKGRRKTAGGYQWRFALLSSEKKLDSRHEKAGAAQLPGYSDYYIYPDGRIFGKILRDILLFL